MKKSIKYAGIAAATLLAVAPIAAPVVSQAATEGNTDIPTSDLNADQVNEAVSSWQGTLVSKTYGSNSNNNGDFPAVAATHDALVTNYNKYMKYSDFANTGLAKAMNSVNTNDATLLKNATNAQIKISAVGYNKVEDFMTYANSLQNTKGSITFTYTIQYVNPDTNATETTAAKTFTLTNSQASSDTSIAATFTTPYEVATGSNVANAKLSTSTDFQLKNKDGDKLTSSQITMGNVYKNLAAAKTDNGSDVYTKATFDADTYYQPMTIKLTDGQFGMGADGTTPLTAASIITGYNNGTDDYIFTVNGGTPTVANSNFKEASGNTVTVIRAIKAADNNSASWTTEDTKGVVTTKSDKQFYTLKNGNNDFISDRALAKNTAWQTNAVRTNTVTGEKQYRVGADEWIDANNVTFSDKATDNNNGEGAYTDVKALNGKVVTAGPSGFYYPLYDDNGKMISDRGVAGLSAWYTDKSAVNANGDIVYHVATGEWLQGKNATYTAY